MKNCNTNNFSAKPVEAEVAGLLNISIKTVEVHMGLAIAHFRESLAKYESQHNKNYILTIAKTILLLLTLSFFFNI